MATITQVLNLSDGVSGPLAKISTMASNAAGKVETLSERLIGVRTSGNAAASAATGVREIGTAAGVAATEVEAAGARATGVFSAMRTRAAGMVASIKAQAMSLAGMFTAFFAMDTLSGMMSKAMTAAGALAGAELKLKVIMQQRAGATMEDIDAVKQLIGAQQSLGVISRATQTAGAQQLATFINQKDSLLSLVPALNNMLAQQKGANATSEDAIAVANMMGRALMGNVGALTRCGVTLTEEQENMIKYGNEQQRVAALAQAVTDNVGNMNAEIGKTKGGQAAQAMNQVNDVLAEVGRNVNGVMKDLKIASAGLQVGTIRLFGDVLIFAANAAKFLLTNAQAAFGTISSVVSSNLSIILPILGTIIAELAVMNAGAVAAALSSVWASVTASAGAIAHAAASAIETAAIIALTFAQEGLNAAIALCPMTWIIGAIVALIGVVFLAIAIFNKFAGTSISVVGIIFGAFAWLGTMIMNVVKAIANYFITLANFLGGLFHDPATAIYNLFVDIWDGVADYVSQAVNDIIDMINAIPGIDKVIDHVGHVSAKTFNRKSYADGYQGVAKTFELGDATFNAGQAYDFGASIGDGIGDFIGGGLDKILKMPELPDAATGAGDNTPPAIDASNLPMGGDDGSAGNVGKIKDNTDKISDGIQQMNEKYDMTEEEMRELRDLALQTTISSWQDNHKIDIHIDQTNQVASDVDIDGMTSDIIDGLRNAIDTHPEGMVMT